MVFREPRPDPRVLSYPHVVEPLWFSQAGTNTCASAIQWAQETFRFAPGRDFLDMDELASRVSAGADGLLFHPYLLGERCPYWNGRLRASFTGMGYGHGAAHFVRALYEGTAFSLRDAYSALEPEDGKGPVELFAVGGGTASRVWLQVVSDVFGLPLFVSREADSCYGAGAGPDLRRSRLTAGREAVCQMSSRKSDARLKPP